MEALRRRSTEKIRNIASKQIEADEIWGFIGAKRKNAERAGAYGDCGRSSRWTLTANSVVGRGKAGPLPCQDVYE
jgi:hypothetical protein